MKVACPSCRALFEIDASIAEGPGLPLCDACSGAGLAPPPPPQARRARPKVPEMSFGKRTAKTEDAAAPAPAPTAPQPSALDVDPVSLRDLGMVLGPATVPPAWSDAPVTMEPPPQASPRDAESSGLMDIRRLAATASERVEPAHGKPVAAAPSAPPEDDIPVFTDDEPPPPSSDPLDWKRLLGPSGDDEPPRSSGSLLNLSGGLFGGLSEPQKPIELEPQAELTAPLAPVLRLDRAPPSVRVPVARDEADDDTSSSPKSGAPGPVVSERSPARRSSTLGWMVAVIVGAGLIGLVAGRLSTPRQEGREVAVTPNPTVTTPRALDPPARVVNEPREVPAPTIETAPPPASAAAQPSETARPVEPARTAVPSPTATNRAPAPPVTAAAVTTAAAPVTAAPAPPPVPQPAPAPAPAPAGGEFNTAAAKTAMAAASSAAAGCKDPDDPSGGARVSVTFAPSGRVTSSRVMGAPFQGTKTGSCIARAFRTITVPAFSGDPVTINTQVSVR